MKTNIIYILGHGRSGSTLLDLLISSQNGIASIGQFVRFQNSLENSLVVKCTCGNMPKKCMQWAPIIEEQTNILIKDKNTFINSPFFEKGHRLKQLYKSILFTNNCNINKNVVKSNQHHSDLVKSICKSSNCSYLVDSSKNINRFLSLYQSQDINVTTVFLMRDMIGVCRSKNKTKSERRSGIFLSSLSWAIQNISSALLYKKISGEKIYVNYNEIVKDPDKLLKKIVLETKLNIQLVKTNRNINTKKLHMIAGNSIKKDEYIYIQNDDNEKSRSLNVKEYFFDTIIGKPVYFFVSYLCGNT